MERPLHFARTSLLSGCVTGLYARFVSASVPTAVFLFISSFAVLVSCELFYIIVVWPLVSPLRHIPTAPQGPFYKRLFKEPGPYHFERWAETIPHNGLIRYFGVFNIERLLVLSPEGIHEVFQAKTYDFVKQYPQWVHLRWIAEDGLVLLEGDAHKALRKLQTPVYKKDRFEWYYRLFWSKAAELAVCMAAALDVEKEKSPPSTHHAPSTGHPGPVLAVDKYIHRAVFDTVGLAGYGFDFKSLQDPSLYYDRFHNYRGYFKPSHAMRLRVYLAYFFPAFIVNWLPIEFNRTTGHAIADFRSLGAEIVAAKRQKLAQKKLSQEKEKADQTRGGAAANETPPDMIDMLMTSSTLSDRELITNFLTVQASGIHTTAISLRSCLYFLAQPQNMHIQRKLRAELHRTFGANFFTTSGMNDNPGVTDPIAAWPQTLPHPQQLGNIPYLRAIINEALRLHPPFSWLARTPAVHSSILNHAVPKGTPVSFSPWATGRNPAYWGPDAKQFRPERWVEDASGRGGATSRYAWTPFGAGPRACICINFAKAGVECFVAAVLGRWEVSFVEGCDAPKVTHLVTLNFGGLKLRMRDVGGGEEE